MEDLSGSYGEIKMKQSKAEVKYIILSNNLIVDSAFRHQSGFWKLVRYYSNGRLIQHKYKYKSKLTDLLDKT